ncbi:MAG: hypothetical protein U1F57_03880 [bacterium]
MRRKFLRAFLSVAIFLFFGTLGKERAQADENAAKPTQKELEETVNNELGDCNCKRRSISLTDWHVTVIDSGVRDEATEAVKTEGVIRFEDNQWVFKKAQISEKCAPGRGHTDFSEVPCS